MPLRVVCFCKYLCDVDLEWRPDDYNAYKFIQAIKGRSLNGYAQIPVLGPVRRLTNSNLNSAIDWAGQIMADYFRRRNINPPFALVPVPGRTCTVRSHDVPRTTRLAEAIATRTGAGSQVADCLRWKKIQKAASKGGPREAEILYRNLTVIKPLQSVPHILVDDVKTSGGHLQASAAVLKEKGPKIRMAVCAGRTVYDQSGNPFEVSREVIEDYEP